ncbi:MAG: hypothetical protein C4341_00220 [Armatimonadota bacterium]
MARYDAQHEEALEQLADALTQGVRPVVDQAARLGSGMISLEVREAPGGLEVVVRRGPFAATSPVVMTPLPESWRGAEDTEALTERVAAALSRLRPKLGFVTKRHNYLPLVDELVRRGCAALDDGSNTVAFLKQDGEKILGRPMTSEEIREVRFRLLRLRRVRKDVIDL